MPLQSRGGKNLQGELERKWQKRAVIRDRSRGKKKRKEIEGALGVMGDNKKESFLNVENRILKRAFKCRNRIR